MNYRRVPRFRRYPSIRPDSGTIQDSNINTGPAENENSKTEIANIPMPNENEITAPNVPNNTRNNKPMFLSNFIKNIHADDLLLLGLIFILIQENLEDEFLIIVLIYLLVAGMN